MKRQRTSLFNLLFLEMLAFFRARVSHYIEKESHVEAQPLAILPAMLPLPHALPCTAKELLNIGRERRHRALVCAFIVEGIKFRASSCLAML